MSNRLMSEENIENEVLSKIIDLEIKLSYTENTVEILNQTVIEQQLKIQKMQSKLDEIQSNMVSYLKNIETDLHSNQQIDQQIDSNIEIPDAIKYEIPPHY